MIATPHTTGLPPALDAEAWTIGSVLRDPSVAADVIGVARPQSFGDPILRLAAEAIERRVRNGEPIDVALLLSDLQETAPDYSGARVRIACLADEIHTAAHAAYYAAQVRDAAQKRRIRDEADRISQAALNGHSGRDLLHELKCFAEDELSGEERPGGVSQYTLGQLRRQFPEQKQPVIDGLLRRGEVCNVVSMSKVGKSWLGYSLALSVITGREWLGQFPTRRGKVLLIDNELHPETLAKRIPDVAHAMAIKAAECE